MHINLDALRGLSLSGRRLPFFGQFLQERRQAVRIVGGMLIFFAEVEVVAEPFEKLPAVFEGNTGDFHAFCKDPCDVFRDVFHKISRKPPNRRIKQNIRLKLPEKLLASQKNLCVTMHDE